jgi:biotin carboxyl carrier protein
MVRRIVELDGETFVFDVVQTSADSFEVTPAHATRAGTPSATRRVTVDTSASLVLAIVDTATREFAFDASGSALMPRGLPGRVIAPRRGPVTAREAPGHGAGHGAVVAPMPGRVIAVLVVAGQRVQAGKPVAIVEAMKMQNELVAAQSGVVRRIAAMAGQSVERGAVLMEIEP